MNSNQGPITSLFAACFANYPFALSRFADYPPRPVADATKERKRVITFYKLH